jgi:hypothetical protein
MGDRIAVSHLGLMHALARADLGCAATATVPV